uniref:Odorant receptor n=1 Tax=Eucryptorrhynchus scrobiculatus TaxID=1552824 RepID=A0A8F4MZ61_EUCSC|nr:odorant receptor 34 [Eucryptorrhynchus scrobiculatus]
MRNISSLKNDFLGICIPFAYYFCILPDIVEFKKIFYKAAYKFYTVIIYLMAIACQAGQFVKLYQLFHEENKLWDEIIRNYTTTSVHCFALMKCVFLRGKVSGEIFKKVLKYEEDVYESDNQDLKSVYQSALASVTKTRFYLAGIIGVVGFYIIALALGEPYYIQKGNETVTVRRLLLSAWTPWEDSILLSFLATSLMGAYLSMFFIVSDMICYSLIFFGICQTEVLHLYISHFSRYSTETQETDGHAKWISRRLHQRKCIIIHQEIISYVKDLNDVMKNIMILDFVPSSIQLAGMIYQMMTYPNIVQGILVSQFVITLIGRNFIYCNAANVLAVRSKMIAYAWYETDWTEMPPDVKKNILICITRSQRPLYIGIGNFQNISLETFLVIMKGTYSYVMLLTTI